VLALALAVARAAVAVTPVEALAVVAAGADDDVDELLAADPVALPVEAVTVVPLNSSGAADAAGWFEIALAIVTDCVCDAAGAPDDPDPWTMITAATTAVAKKMTFFNVCTPIQRLHCPPN
jgi:hypothetical protein